MANPFDAAPVTNPFDAESNPFDGPGTEGLIEGAPNPFDVAPQAVPEKPSIVGELFNRIGPGFQQQKVGFTQFGAVAAQALGFEETAKDLAASAARQEADITPAAVGSLDEIQDSADFGRFIAGFIGENVPFILTTMASGGGAVVARLAGVAAARGLGLKGAVAALNKGLTFQTGAFAGVTAVETGFTSRELTEKTGEIEPAASLAAGIVKGAANTLPILVLARKLGLKFGQADDLVGRITANFDRISSRPGRIAAVGGAGFAFEGVQEAFDESVDAAVVSFLDENSEFFSKATADRLKNAMVGGAFAGLFFGGLAGSVGRSSKESDAKLRRREGIVVEDEATEEGFVPPDDTPPDVEPEAGPISPLDVPVEVVKLKNKLLSTTARNLASFVAETPQGVVHDPLPAPATAPEDVDSPTPSPGEDEDIRIGDAVVDPGAVEVAARRKRIELRRQPIVVPGASAAEVQNVATAAFELDTIDRRITKGHTGALPKEVRKAFREITNVEATFDNFGEGTARSSTAKVGVATASFNTSIGSPKKAKATQVFRQITGILQAITERAGDGNPQHKTAARLARAARKSLARGPNGNPSALNGVVKIIRGAAKDEAAERNLSIGDSENRVAASIVAQLQNLQDSIDAIPVYNRLQQLTKDIGSEFAKGLRLSLSKDFRGALLAFERADLKALELEALATTDTAAFTEIAFSYKLDNGQVVTYEPIATIENRPVQTAGLLPGATVPPPPEIAPTAAPLSLPGTPESPIAPELNPVNPVDRSFVREWAEKQDNDEESLAHVNGVWEGLQEKDITIPKGRAWIVDTGAVVGRARVKDGKPNVPKNLQAFENFAQVFLTQFFPNMSIAIRLTTFGEARGTVEIAGDRAVIDLDRTTMLKGTFDPKAGARVTKGVRPARVKAFLTLTHELAHILFNKKFALESTGIQASVIQAYNEAISKLDSNRNEAVAQMKFINSVVGANVSAGDTKYWYKLHEWFANQVVLHLTTQTQALNAVDEYFIDLSKDLKALYKKTAKKSGVSFNAEESLSAYMDSLQEGQKDGAQAYILDAKATADALQIAEASEALADIDSPYANSPAPKHPQHAGWRRPGFFKKFAEIVGATIAKGRLAEFDRIKWGLQARVLTVIQMADRHPSVTSLREYIELWRLAGEEADRWRNDALKVLEDRINFAGLKVNSKKSKDYDAFIAWVDDMSYLSEEDLVAGITRRPTDIDLATGAEIHGLDERHITQYRKEESLYDQALNAYMDQADVFLEQIFADNPTELSKQKAALIGRRLEMANRPYIPHSRFGEWWIWVRPIVTNKQGERVLGDTVEAQTFESPSAVEKNLSEFEKRYPSGAFQITVNRAPKELNAFAGMPRWMLEQMISSLDTQEGLAREILGEAGSVKDLKAWLRREFFRMSPENAAAKRFLKRKGTLGWSTDSRRSFANYFQHFANHMARLKYKEPMRQAIQQVNGEVVNQITPDPNMMQVRGTITTMLKKHFEEVMHPTEDWAKMRAMAFTYHIGFSPASAILNLTQVPIVTIPFLAAKISGRRMPIGGNTESVAEVTAAIRFATFDIQRQHKRRAGAPQISDENMAIASLLQKQSVVDQSLALHLAGQANTGVLERMMGDRFGEMMGRVNEAGAWMFAQTEKINRRVTMGAALSIVEKHQKSGKANDPVLNWVQDLLDKNPLEVERLTDPEGEFNWSIEQVGRFLAARDAVDNTQFNYQQWARPALLRGRKGAILMFFMFTQQMVYYSAFNAGNVRYLIGLFAIAGLMGLPGGEDMFDIATFMGKKIFGRDFNLEVTLREMIGSMGDEVGLSKGQAGVAADVALHGISRYGFGVLPAIGSATGIGPLSFDFSGSVGLGRVIPGVEALTQASASFDSQFTNAVSDIAGATFSPILNILKFMSDTQLPITDPKRAERILPRAFRQGAQAFRFFDEERERTRGGQTLIEFNMTDPMHAAEVALQALGFRPTRLARAWDREIMEREAIMPFAAQRSWLLNQFFWAKHIARDPSEVRQAKKDIQSFNREVRSISPRMRIGGDTLRQSVNERLRRNRLEERGRAPTKSEQPFKEQAARLIPDIFTEDAPR